MKDGLYHKSVGFPGGLEFSRIADLLPTSHCLINATERNISPLPTIFDPQIAEVIEIQIERGKIYKILARQPLDTYRDICYAFLVETRYIKTVWINLNDDRHATLDRSRYIVPAL